MKSKMIVLGICAMFLAAPVCASASLVRTGDVNDAGGIDLNDVVLALKTAAGMPDTPVKAGADVNQDGHIGIEEAVFDLQVVAGLKITPNTYGNSYGMTFVLLEMAPDGNTFMMGSPAEEIGRSGRETLHEVKLTKSFFLQTTEVTQKQWIALTGYNPSRFDECGGDCPVENITWEEARTFVSAINIKENSTSYRMPTEAEWEYAARAGTDTAFWFGGITSDSRECINNDLAARDWFCANKCVTGYYTGSACTSCDDGCGTHPVGMKEANPWGLYDMYGNVAEWCRDIYADYPAGPVTDPVVGTLDEIGERVYRGGAWRRAAADCRSAERPRGVPQGAGDEEIGFRLAVTPN